MIAGMTYYQILWYFVIYSFGGWCVEVIFHAITVGKVINRGFLCGPACPVYGFGAISVFAVIYSVLPDVVHYPVEKLTGGNDIVGILLVFVCGVVFATLIELAAGWLLDIAFHARWWDYSNEPFNFRGYICLRFSLIWGLVCLLVVRIIHPVVENCFLLTMPEKIGQPILGALFITYAADFIVTVMIVAGLNKKLKELDEVQRRMSVLSDNLSEKLATGTMSAQKTIEEQRVQATLAKYEARDAVGRKKTELQAKTDAMKKRQREMQAQAEAVKQKIMSGSFFGTRRILEAFPDMKHRDYEGALENIRKGMQ
ncbi:MAG: hypothetical protein Q4A32_05880 [Lachnospiraceae bacterium]|nr:hypothetical protein [Lachnospiraceae bacterium]